jgi:hypothetical protein
MDIYLATVFVQITNNKILTAHFKTSVLSYEHAHVNPL